MSLGGVGFYKSIIQSLQIGNYVRNRARKNKQCEAPIKCIENSVGVFHAHVDGADLRPQKKSGEKFFLRRPVPKERQFAELSGGLQRAGRAGAPEHLFGLPFFDEQTGLIAGVEPSSCGDAASFLFVDLNRFMARNASSVLHNVIFCSA